MAGVSKTDKRMRIYIAGPYTKGDVALNVRAAIFAGNAVALYGHYPFIPHLTHLWHTVLPQEYEFWMRQDEEWLRVCDAVVRIPGDSAGADREVKLAKSLGLKVYYSVFDVPRYQPSDDACNDKILGSER